MIYDGDTIEVLGLTFKVALPFDDWAEAPWEREDGHGPVTGWVRRSKHPGERLLASDRGFKRFYDFQEAVRMAKRDGWWFSGMTAADFETLSPGVVAAKAAEDDYQRLRRWLNDQWHYVGCVVTLLDPEGNETDFSDALWGLESDSGKYLEEVAYELANRIAEPYHQICAAKLEATRPDLYSLA